MIKGQFAKNLHKAVSERGIKQVELWSLLVWLWQRVINLLRLSRD